ncbi:hypothetical protein DUNSADRAFT_7791 [Dunaliella salina]|uniref:AMP-dependent synthetase/ligase domain-containing protein n=1 Tax=Dunaliella salina TaxID=3046 RepID=A0ABQ7FT68_DUNSA|nr:hypothetical protein DUNSADRAFT_7791 [Dunaliella salina]|eukprot:KAF5825658.1 hypothetical protein DUNSADRAFT_7791 [Dunaliella salina]
MFGPLLAGASILVLRRSTVLQPSLMAQALMREGVSHFVAVPSVLRLMLPTLRTLPIMSGPASLEPHHLLRCRLGWEDMETAGHGSPSAASGMATPRPGVVPGGWQKQQCSLRLVVSSGEPLSLQLCQQLREVLPGHCKLLNLYGVCLESIFTLPNMACKSQYTPLVRFLSHCLPAEIVQETHLCMGGEGRVWYR